MTASLLKAELHCHIEGAAPPALVAAQAEKYGIDASSFIRNGVYVWEDFTSFIAAYDFVASVFRSEEDFAALAEAYLSELAGVNTIYSELFVSPDHGEAVGLSAEAYIEGLAEGIVAARAKTGIECRMVIIGERHLGPENVLRRAKWLADYQHPLITGFNMAGEERVNRVADYAPAFDIAREAGYGITIHAGELCGAFSVRDALDLVRPSRIGHGVRAIEDADLVQRLADEGVVLEVCPASNIALKVFEDYASHPMRDLADAGVRICINSDDPPFFATSLANDYAIAAEMGFSNTEINAMTQTAIEAAFVDEATRQNLLRRLQVAGSGDEAAI
ncbi:adenosine deaminase [Agrobacterium vitis]|uniref:Adenine deaminase n=1 Tax=Agrobacterium vitis TaxID=373 RepID=A0AAE4WD34_AGRVI|nr:adenosine deaminase [Agrobacterium vitis]MCF1499422.1 adenosine deaminase [Allorhizobium sp. Av2]MCM2439326.1 adenosine deaminase [Agrobacterium vitis]MUZ57770.1 adenosine deaminase [Agrobacterium vitis]MVA67830.1 adenosine deaminase [Agrobacterium vitis]MVA87731.1 adenosine deaminase [Agrobacterium vitis]